MSRTVLTIIFLNCFYFSLKAQRTSTVAPFLNMLPDARSAAMGEAGAATTADVNSIGTNPAKVVFIPKKFGFSASYSPWLRSLAADINLGYLSAFYRVDASSAIAGSLRYFSLGEVQFTNAEQQDLGTYHPADVAADIVYSKRFGQSFSLGTAIRYISSNGFTPQSISGSSDQSIKTVAADVSAYFVHSSMLFGYEADLSAGLSISNIGAALRFVNDGNKYYLPTNLRLGVASSFVINDADQLVLTVDANRLLVPSPIQNSTDRVPALQQTTLGAGLEFVYHEKLALRSGYVYESPKSGNRRYVTVGTGLRYEAFQVDCAYILAGIQKSPLANTLRFTLMFNFGAGD
jgi:hypothetical protein